jgi:hypothetical protein
MQNLKARNIGQEDSLKTAFSSGDKVTVTDPRDKPHYLHRGFISWIEHPLAQQTDQLLVELQRKYIVQFYNGQELPYWSHQLSLTGKE